MDERDTQRLYEEAVRRAPADRASFLDVAVRGDPALRAEIEARLARVADASDPFSTPPVIDIESATILTGRGSAAEREELAPGTRLGRYVVRELIGVGGFAFVYLADQEEPVRRHVALKVLRRGLESDEVLARFEAERQALALMDHPHVASVFDAGATDDGRPFFVMEHIAGEPITTYCDRHRLPNRQRLELFLQACDAIQHAHQKGIIHRDVKPPNILVTVKGGRPFVKVIDFGVAKAIAMRLTDRTIHTRRGQAIGTPAYMSPEQAEMTTLDVDTRTDVYSLGVVLYQLLTGLLPFDPMDKRHARSPEIQRIIREEKPAAPSTRLSDLGQSTAEAAMTHAARPRTLVRELRGDLDAIALKALEKDRTDRYATAAAFGLDIDRYLAGEPILAKPPSIGRRVRRLLKVALLAVASLLVLAIAVTPFMPKLTSGTLSQYSDQVAARTSESPDVRASPAAEDPENPSLVMAPAPLDGDPRVDLDPPGIRGEPDVEFTFIPNAARSRGPASRRPSVRSMDSRGSGGQLREPDTERVVAEATEIRRQLLNRSFPSLEITSGQIVAMTTAEVDVRLLEIGLARLMRQPFDPPEVWRRLDREYELLIERRAALASGDDATDRAEDAPAAAPN